MEKQFFHWHGKDYLLIGEDNDGIKYWLEKPIFECDLYWGLGYVETFTNNLAPARSDDIQSHQHFDSLFFNRGKFCYDVFNEFFKETVFEKNELWKLLETMKTLYTLRRYADMLQRSGSNITVTSTLERYAEQNKVEYNRIVSELIPAVWNDFIKEHYDMLGNETLMIKFKK